MRAPRTTAVLLVALIAGSTRPANASERPTCRSEAAGRFSVDSPDSTAAAAEEGQDEDTFDDPATAAIRAPEHRVPAKLEPLVPALAENAYRLADGPRPYLNRLAFSPGFGRLGTQRLFVFRLAFHPSSWLGWEATLNHNPAQSVHALHHSLSAVVRRPLSGRFQPFLAGGYGMFMVFPGRSLNADPVTKNALSGGGGLEIFIRDDLALRGDMRRTTVFGREKDRAGVVAYDYLEQSIALVFYRTLSP